MQQGRRLRVRSSNGTAQSARLAWAWACLRLKIALLFALWILGLLILAVGYAAAFHPSEFKELRLLASEWPVWPRIDRVRDSVNTAIFGDRESAGVGSGQSPGPKYAKVLNALERLRDTKEVPLSPPRVLTPVPSAEPKALKPNPTSPLARALGMPENAMWAMWLARNHQFAAPTPSMARLPYCDWECQDGRTIGWEGAARIVDSNIPPERLSVMVAVDQALADAIERHFGFPDGLTAPTGFSHDLSLHALLGERDRTFGLHGVTVSERVISPDLNWVVRQSTSCVKPVALAVLSTRVAAGRSTDARRAMVERLVNFVQAAIPYADQVEAEQQARYADGNYRFGLRTPGAVLIRGGDCDSKVILLATLIRAVDDRLALCKVDVDGGDHSILAVGLNPIAGEMTWDSPRGPMVLVETTGDWGIGRLRADTRLNEAEVTWIE